MSTLCGDLRIPDAPAHRYCCYYCSTTTTTTTTTATTTTTTTTSTTTSRPPPAYQLCSLKYQGWAVTNLNRRGSWWNVPHPRKIIKNAVNASSLCMCALRIDVIMPPPSPSPLPTLPHPSPPPGIPTHYESTKPFGIPRKPVFPQFLRGFNMRNLANIVGRGGAPPTTTTTTTTPPPPPAAAAGAATLLLFFQLRVLLPAPLSL